MKFLENMLKAKTESPAAFEAWQNTPMSDEEASEMAEHFMQTAGSGLPPKGMAASWAILISVMGVPMLKKIAASLPDGAKKDFFLMVIKAAEAML